MPNQYREQNAVRRVEGYYLPRAGEPLAIAFARAKEETVTNLRRDLEDTESVTFEQFKSLLRIEERAALEGTSHAL